MTEREMILAPLFRLEGETIIRVRTGQVVRFTPTKRGYGNVQYVSPAGKTGIGYHRLKFFLHKGYLPSEVDHEDGDTSNNTEDNLRPATRQENARNRGSMRNSSTGFKGVCLTPKGYLARIRIDGKLKYLGIFKSPEAAFYAYEAAAKEAFGAFYRLPT